MKRVLWILSISLLIACSGEETKVEDSTAAADWQAGFDELMKEHQDFMNSYNEKVGTHDEWMAKHEASGDTAFQKLNEAHNALLRKHEDFIETYAFDIKSHQDLKAAFDKGEKDDAALQADIDLINQQIKALQEARDGMITTVEALSTEHMQKTASNEDDGFEDDL